MEVNYSFCPECGNKVEGKQKYCNKCWAELKIPIQTDIKKDNLKNKTKKKIIIVVVITMVIVIGFSLFNYKTILSVVRNIWKCYRWVFTLKESKKTNMHIGLRGDSHCGIRLYVRGMALDINQVDAELFRTKFGKVKIGVGLRNFVPAIIKKN